MTMTAMHCDRAGELIGAYLDQELDADQRREVAAHLGDCPQCAATADDLARISRQLVGLGRERAPARLAMDIRKRVAEAQAGMPLPPRRGATGHLRDWSWVRRAAVLVVLCGLTAVTTVFMMSRSMDT